MRFLPALLIGVLVLSACGGAKATEPPPTVSPLGHAWVVRIDSAFVGASYGPAAGGTATYDWCPLHDGGHKPRSDAEAIDAMQWVAAHPHG